MHDDAQRESRLVRLDVLRLLPGMFVAALDRPWGDTPFPDTGLLIESDGQLEILRRHCHQVEVDPARSLDAMSDAIKVAAILSGPASFSLIEDDPDDRPENEEPVIEQPPAEGHRKPAKIASALRLASRNAASLLTSTPRRRDDVHPDRQALEELRVVLRAGSKPAAEPAGGAATRIRRWLRPANGKAAGASVQDSLQALRERYGTTIGQTEPAAPLPLREVLAQARTAHAQVVSAVDRLFAQVRLGDIPAVVTLDEPIRHFVDAAGRSPDAMRWAHAIYTQRTPQPNPAPAVAMNLVIFGRSLGMPAIVLQDLARIGLLLDLGKALLPQNLLEHPGVLESKDFALVQQHVTIGLELLERMQSVSPPVLRAIAEHHERLDGSGYPRQLRGDSIGLYGRMAAIADTFHGLTAIRAYANAMSVENALSALNQWSSSLFCRELVEHFARATGIYPVGTLVELTNGEVAAVVDQRPGPRPKPRLVMIANASKGPLRDTGDVSVQAAHGNSEAARIRIARGLRTGAWGLRLPDHHD